MADAPEASSFPEAESGGARFGLRSGGATADGNERRRRQTPAAVRHAPQRIEKPVVFNIPRVSTAGAGVGSEGDGCPELRAGFCAKVAPWQSRSVFCPGAPSIRSRHRRCRCGSPLGTKNHGKTGGFHAAEMRSCSFDVGKRLSAARLAASAIGALQRTRPVGSLLCGGSRQYTQFSSVFWSARGELRAAIWWRKFVAEMSQDFRKRPRLLG